MDNEPCPNCNGRMEFRGYATYYDGRYSLWVCNGCGVDVAKQDGI